MKSLPRPRLSRLTCLAALFAATQAAAALTLTEWPQRQTVTVAAPGLVKLAVPAATFDRAQPDLSDLRLLGPAGQEIPYLLDRDLASDEAARLAAPRQRFAPAAFRSAPAGDTTQLTIETGTTASIETLELETSVPFFLKAAHVEISTDGTDWQSLGAALPLFRQFGAELVRIGLNRPAAFIRVTVDDFRSRPVTFTGARLLAAPAHAAPPTLVPVGVQLTRRDEFADESVLTLTLDGGHVPLAALSLGISDPLFMRRVSVTVREVRGAVSAERVVGTGTLYRVALDGTPARAQLELPLEFAPATRELLVHIHNGDSPPLTIDGVEAKQHAVNLAFMAPASGAFTLLSGNPQAAAPRYDLAAFAAEMHLAGATLATVGGPEPMPDYHPRDSLGTPPLPDVPLAGAPLDAQDWKVKQAVQLAAPGVQELELSLAALAQARPDFGDLRLLHGGNQIPYVLENPGLARALALTPTSAPDPKHPTKSVWQLRLPQTGLPLTRVVLTTSTALFERQFRLFEKIPDNNGGSYEYNLAAGAWSRTPEPGVPVTRAFDLLDRMHTNTLWIETDNGDNPAIALTAVQATYPVVRLIFKTGETDGFALAYGNRTATAPRYDLSLVAVKLLTSTRNVARLAADQPDGVAAGSWLGRFDNRYLFWGALALVVVVLLVVMAKLLPQPPAPKS